MSIELEVIPCLADNYAYLIHDRATGATAVIDVPDEGPILAILQSKGWILGDILITHHHNDHIAGVDALRSANGARVTGAAADAHRLPKLDRLVADGDRFDWAGTMIDVLDVSGHTLGHVAYHLPSAGLVFTADSLMAGGCGRLFEGKPDQMWKSLSRLADLPPETLVCSGHEYTASNLRFAATLDPENPELMSRIERVAKARAEGRATVPSTLSEELATNPFLRARTPVMKARLGMADASDAEAFAEIRARKDRF